MPSAKPKATLLNTRGWMVGSANPARLPPVLPSARLALTTACAHPPLRRAGTVGSSCGRTASAGPHCTASLPPRQRPLSLTWRRARWVLGAQRGGGPHSSWARGGHGGSP